jgi:2,5-dichloro-2,5-cyclohexadiene-1,4-diol dehydrogenase 1
MALKGLEGKSFIVTGGASGIGRASVERLLAEGSFVTVFDRDEDAVASTLSEVGDDRIAGVIGDVSAEDDVERAFSQTIDRTGGVAGIFNNAAVTAPASPMIETTVEELLRVWTVDVVGPFLGMRWMIQTATRLGTPGVVLNVGSSLALSGSPGHGAYCAAKAAVLSMTRTAAREAAAAGVRVNALLPGPIATSLLASIPQELRDVALAQNPMKRFGAPAEVAALAAWLLSDESSYVNGANYLVDGGEQA